MCLMFLSLEITQFNPAFDSLRNRMHCKQDFFFFRHFICPNKTCQPGTLVSPAVKLDSVNIIICSDLHFL